MKTRMPPKLATWLLLNFGSGPHLEAVVGDLLERFTASHSSLWYWRQVLVAIAAGFGQEVRSHKSVALHAILTGMGATVLGQMIVVAPLLGLFSGFMPASWWRDRWLGVREGELLLLLVSSGALPIAIGWIVARLHRPHHTMAMLAFWLTTIVWEMPRLYGVLGNSFEHERFRYYVGLQVFGLLLASIATLIGGVIGGRTTPSVALRRDTWTHS
jgi:hypothetical protein